ncbi:MAG: ATP-binding protein [Candidatus Methanomethylicia archaeon]
MYGKLLFDLHPKENISELFGRSFEVNYIIDQIINGNWVVILGQRMIGKTSLLKVSLNELEKKGYSTIYINLRGIRSLEGLLNLLIHEINRRKSLLETLKPSLNLQIGPLGIELKHRNKPYNNLLELFLSLNRKTVIGIDEFQEVSKASRQLLNILANTFASNRNISFIFTGSYIGVVKALFEQKSTSPLYGRQPTKIILKPFNEETSKNFLIKGFEEQKMKISEETLEEVYKRFNGIVGWLTLFGNFHTIRKYDVNKAIIETINEARKIMETELEHFLKDKIDKDIYKTIIQNMKRFNKWSEIKLATEIKLGRKINDKTFTQILNTLLNSNIINKTNHEYHLADPILKELY